ncbi:MAG TPA: hypothetical protein VGZ22_28215 [Isosphaeraceae bacterium]|jgi:hypothetical protein|nr:hypothetical protein [Isosphaeraceae bacterium]
MPLGSRWPTAQRLLPALLVALTALAGCQGLPAPRANPDFHAGAEQPDKASQPDDPLPPLPSDAKAETPPSVAQTSQPQPTPLLDAALARAQEQQQAILHELRDPELGSIPVATAPAGNAPVPPSPIGPEATPATTSGTTEPPPPLAPGEPQTEPEASAVPHEPAPMPEGMPAPVFVPGNEEPGAPPAPATQPGNDEIDRLPTWPWAMSEKQAVSSSAASAPPVAQELPAEPLSVQLPPVESDEKPLAIADLRLCRRVLGFGNFEAVDTSACKAGQAVVLYCEVVNLRYEQNGSSYQSRLEGTVEVFSSAGGDPVWKQPLGAADDICSHPRRDYFVNYLLTLPETLPPGSYQLRVTQRDSIANRTAVRGVSFSIAH